jgi:hypothetical protein
MQTYGEGKVSLRLHSESSVLVVVLGLTSGSREPFKRNPIHHTGRISAPVTMVKQIFQPFRRPLGVLAGERRPAMFEEIRLNRIFSSKRSAWYRVQSACGFTPNSRAPQIITPYRIRVQAVV